MSKTDVKWEQEQEPLSFPKWLKSYHLLFFATLVVLIFGAIIKQYSTVNHKMITLILILAGVACFGLFIKSIDFFDKI